MSISKGDKVKIIKGAEKELYRDCVFEVVSDVCNLWGDMVVKIKCNNGKGFEGWRRVDLLGVVEEVG